MKRHIILLSFLFSGALLAQEDVWKSRINLSYVNMTGNSRTESFSGQFHSEAQWKACALVLGGQYVLSSQDGQEKANRLDLNARIERTLSGRLFGFVAVTGQSDRFSGYDYRISVGPGLGMNWMKSETQSLKALLSGIYYWDAYALPGSPTDDFATIKAAVNHLWTMNENVSLKTNADYFSALEEGNRYFINGDISLEAAMSRTLSLGVTWQVKYQNKPPSDEIKTTDTSFLTSLIVNL